MEVILIEEKLLIIEKFLLNVYRTVWRICILMLGCKGLRISKSRLHHSIPSDKCPFLLVPGVPFEKRAGH